MCILHANRTQEVLKARWDQFDLESRVWTIPEENMKKGIEHRIPLTDRALEILNRLHTYRVSDYVFPNQSTGHHLSQAGMSSVLKRMQKDNKWQDKDGNDRWTTEIEIAATVTIRNGNTPQRTAEHALAHRLKDASEAAYQRADLIEKRQILMQVWANYCYPSGAKVINMPRVKNIN